MSPRGGMVHLHDRCVYLNALFQKLWVKSSPADRISPTLEQRREMDRYYRATTSTTAQKLTPAGDCFVCLKALHIEGFM